MYVKFNQALETLKKGKAAKRANWGNTLIYLTEGNFDFDKPHNDKVEGVALKLFQKGDTGTVTRLPHISMKNTNGSTVTGWNPNSADLLTEDWLILDK